MRTSCRTLRLLPAVLAVWCLGCDAFESIAESLFESGAPAAAEISSPPDEARTGTADAGHVGVEAADACDCELGHAAALFAAARAPGPARRPVDFVDEPPGTVLPAPEPLLRPPLA